MTFGKHPTLLYNRLAGAVLSAFLSGLIYLIARRVSGHTVGLAAGLLSAVHLNLIHKSGYIYSEVLSVPLLTLALYWFLVYTDNRKWRFLVLGGLALGLATLARPTTYYMIFLLPLVLWAVHGKMSRIVLARSAVVVAVSLAVITPWAVRNAVVSGRFMPVSELKTWSLLCGCYGPSQFEQPLACDKGVWTGLAGCGLFTEQEAEQLAVTTLDEQERVCKRRFLGYMSTAWPRIPELLLYRALVFIGFDSRPGFFQLYGAQQVLFFGLFVGGLWISRAQWRRFSILHSASLFLGAFMGLAFYAGSRMRLYVDPVIIVFGSAYLVRLAERLFLRQRDTSVVLQPRQAPAQALAARRSR